MTVNLSVHLSAPMEKMITLSLVCLNRNTEHECAFGMTVRGQRALS